MACTTHISTPLTASQACCERGIDIPVSSIGVLSHPNPLLPALLGAILGLAVALVYYTTSPLDLTIFAHGANLMKLHLTRPHPGRFLVPKNPTRVVAVPLPGAHGPHLLHQLSSGGGEETEEDDESLDGLRFDLETMSPSHLPTKLRELLLKKIGVIEPEWANEMTGMMLNWGTAECIDLVTDPDALEEAVAELKARLSGTALDDTSSTVTYTISTKGTSDGLSMCQTWLTAARRDLQARDTAPWQELQRMSSTITQLEELIQYFNGHQVNPASEDNVLFALSPDGGGAVLMFHQSDNYFEIRHLIAEKNGKEGQDPQLRLVKHLVQLALEKGIRDIRMVPLVTSTLWDEPQTYNFIYPTIQSSWLQYQWLQ